MEVLSEVLNDKVKDTVGKIKKVLSKHEIEFVLKSLESKIGKENVIYESEKDLRRVKAAATKADVAIVCIGEMPYAEKSGGDGVPLVDESNTTGKPPYNGQCQPATSRANCCPYFNRNKAHDNPKHLNSRGNCIFRHVCNHWVDNKGPSGRCLGSAGQPGHGWYNCDNPNKCDKALE